MTESQGMAEAFLKLHILDLYHPVPDPIAKDQHAKYRTKKSGVLCIHDFILRYDDHDDVDQFSWPRRRRHVSQFSLAK